MVVSSTIAGFLSPASRGALLTALLVMYLLLAVAAGYTAVFIWGMINRSYEGWYNVCWRVSCYFPGITLGEAHASKVLVSLAVYLQACDSQCKRVLSDVRTCALGITIPGRTADGAWLSAQVCCRC